MLSITPEEFRAMLTVKWIKYLEDERNGLPRECRLFHVPERLLDQVLKCRIRAILPLTPGMSLFPSQETKRRQSNLEQSIISNVQKVGRRKDK